MEAVKTFTQEDSTKYYPIKKSWAIAKLGISLEEAGDPSIQKTEKYEMIVRAIEHAKTSKVFDFGLGYGSASALARHWAAKGAQSSTSIPQAAAAVATD